MEARPEYQSRKNAWQKKAAQADRRFVAIGNTRLALFAVLAAMAWAAFFRGWFSGWWLLLPLAAFIALIVVHERIATRRRFADRALSYYDRALARLEGTWAGRGNPGDAFRDDNHVYANDLDIFGRGSLFELLDTARTAAGEKTLASWLLSPAARDEALRRQRAVAELSGRVDLREDLALLGEDVRAGVHAELAERWGAAPPAGLTSPVRVFALAMAIYEVLTFAAFMLQVIPLWPFLAGLLINIVTIFVLHRRISLVMETVDVPGHDLRILSLVLARLEREQFESPLLTKLRQDLNTDGIPASAAIARLQRWISLLDSADHLFVRVVRPAVLWDEQVAMGIEAWRQKSGAQVGRWLAAVAEFEALSSLAAFSFERAHYIFPELSESEEPCFEAAGLAHPLLPPERSVSNGVRLGGEVRLWIVSGSNMSGKSTLLRAIGLNTVLAWAGAPVAASSLRLTRLQVGASIRITDSLQDGKSRFYAEITRIRSVLDLAGGGRQLLFLLDEILSGTNSHDRRIGASAIVRGLVERGAIGLVTTHDLAIAELEREIGSRATNVHFEDHVENGRIEFDYRLRPGVVTRSNAIELMRAVGLPV